MSPIVRVSILRCPADKFAECARMMAEFEGVTFERPIMNYASLWQIGSAA